MTTPRWATFDCYGTLIDWNSGITGTLERLWPSDDAASLLARYHQLEPVIEQEEPSLSYREVMARVLARIATEFGLPLAVADHDALGASLPDWPAFPEVPAVLAELRARGWKLAILSNTDPDLLEASVQHLGVPIDERVIASDIGSYKPALGHWREFQKRTGATPEQHVHVGASLYHDIQPAEVLGIQSVWIDRVDGSVPAMHRLPDLEGLPDLLDSIVPSDTPPAAPETPAQA